MDEPRPSSPLPNGYTPVVSVGVMQRQTAITEDGIFIGLSVTFREGPTIVLREADVVSLALGCLRWLGTAEGNRLAMLSMLTTELGGAFRDPPGWRANPDNPAGTGGEGEKQPQ